MRRRRTLGFTLVEQLVVMLLIGILAALSLPAFLAQVDRARTVQVQADFREMYIQIKEYQIRHGHYPPDVDPNVMPDEITAFKVKPFTLADSPYDYDHFCWDGRLIVKILWYGWNGRRDDNYYYAYNAYIGDDIVRVIDDGTCVSAEE